MARRNAVLSGRKLASQPPRAPCSRALGPNLVPNRRRLYGDLRSRDDGLGQRSPARTLRRFLKFARTPTAVGPLYALIFAIRQELAVERDLDPVAFRIGHAV